VIPNFLCGTYCDICCTRIYVVSEVCFVLCVIIVYHCIFVYIVNKCIVFYMISLVLIP
jgi:hypothetical protein